MSQNIRPTILFANTQHKNAFAPKPTTRVSRLAQIDSGKRTTIFSEITEVSKLIKKML